MFMGCSQRDTSRKYRGWIKQENEVNEEEEVNIEVEYKGILKSVHVTVDEISPCGALISAPRIYCSA